MEVKKSQPYGTDLMQIIMKFQRIRNNKYPQGPWVEHRSPYATKNQV